MSDTIAKLSELLADCEARGIRLLPNGSGGLTIDAPHDALTSELTGRLKAHKAALLHLLRATPAAAPEPPKPASDAAAKPVCRCGSTTWCDMPIHGGRSVRRDCGRCGRFIDFPLWYRKDTLLNEQHSIESQHGEETIQSTH